MQTLLALFEQWAGERCIESHCLSGGGSNRHYYRLRSASRQCVGAIGESVRENEAFFAISRHLHDNGIPVPQIYAIDPTRRYYLQQDLGDETLYLHLFEKKRQGGGFDAEMLTLYKQALADLATIQIAGRDMDFSVAFPRAEFDRRAMLWDLNYFKYYFLKLAYIPFDEERLENDFNNFIDFLLQADTSFFVYRDFQSRNIMIHDGTLYYIDYQGGRRGAAQYDAASLLYSAKSDIPQPARTELLQYYLDKLLGRSNPAPTHPFRQSHLVRPFLGLCHDPNHAGHGRLWLSGLFRTQTLFPRKHSPRNFQPPLGRGKPSPSCRSPRATARVARHYRPCPYIPGPSVLPHRPCGELQL